MVKGNPYNASWKALPVKYVDLLVGKTKEQAKRQAEILTLRFLSASGFVFQFKNLELDSLILADKSIRMAAHQWKKEIQPLLKKYKGKKHPLDYHNVYELLVMVVLSAQDSDRNINKLAPELFAAFPDMKSLSEANSESLYPFVKKIRNFRNKTKWLLELSSTIKTEKNIPVTLKTLTELPGIGRKSANVIMREAGLPAEGIIVDLHVVRVAPRLGIAQGTDPKKLEKQIMELLAPKDWGEAGMAISFLGRETCRPKNPKCPDCVMNKVCDYYKLNVRSAKVTAG